MTESKEWLLGARICQVRQELWVTWGPSACDWGLKGTAVLWEGASSSSSAVCPNSRWCQDWIERQDMQPGLQNRLVWGAHTHIRIWWPEVSEVRYSGSRVLRAEKKNRKWFPKCVQPKFFPKVYLSTMCVDLYWKCIFSSPYFFEFCLSTLDWYLMNMILQVIFHFPVHSHSNHILRMLC